MKVVALVGAGGGVGTSTLAAHLAAGLAAQRRPALAMDLSPGNTLGLYFGMDFRDPRGLMSQLMAGEPWHEAVFRSPGGVDFLPYGIAPRQVSVAEVWGLEHLHDAHLDEGSIVIVDAGCGDTSLQRNALDQADMVMVVVSADPASAVALPRTMGPVLTKAGRDVVVCLNRFNPSRRLDRDIAVVIRSELGARLSPRAIHEDESFREALARQQTLFDYAPSGQGAMDCHAQVTRMVARLAGQQDAA
ncbi:MAG TPA: cellulose biosynthesis protein BcsQ [Rhodocyclaceae bacterium]|nr:cellulose biosynthesis protein BcsQ [Rhodocyclaceae bacterium]